MARNVPVHMLDHPTLGRIKGIALGDGHVVQFRGIPFASIPARWEDPVLLHGPLTRETFDATCFGPACPQGAGGQRADLQLLGDVHHVEERHIRESEYDCLNVIITRPVNLSLDRKVPVLVWVHGGGFSIGSNAWPQYDLSKLIQYSTKAGRPVIGVSINYRLGVFGFLASAEAGISGNFGLKDQACAFTWIRRNIEGFGGNPNMITAFGESAGAICLSALLATPEPLFSRAVLMSGDVTLRRPRSMAWQETMFRQNLTALNIGAENIREAVERLRAMPALDVTRLLPLTQHWSPVLDSRFFVGLRFSDLRIQNTWCQKVLIGDMAHDGTVLRSRFLSAPDVKERTLAACEDILSRGESREIWNMYDLDGDTVQQKSGLVKLISEIRFYLPVIAACTSLAPLGTLEVQRYHMHQSNPFPGANHGLASHELDVAFLLQNLEVWLADADIQLGRRMAEVLFNFAYGDDDAFEHGKKVLAIGPDHQLRYVGSDSYDSEYRDGRGRLLLDIGWNKCFSLGERLQGVPYPEL